MIDESSSIDAIKQYLHDLPQDALVITAKRHLEDLEYVLSQLKVSDDGETLVSVQ